MNIRIPRALTAKWDAFGEWNNVEIYRRGGFELRRIDVLLFVLGCMITTYYWAFYDWRTALIGALTYIMVAMIAMWIL